MSTKSKTKKAVKASKTADAKKATLSKKSPAAPKPKELQPSSVESSRSEPAPETPAPKAAKAAKERQPSRWWTIISEELGLWRFIWKDSGMLYHITKNAEGKRTRQSLKTRDEAEARRLIAGGQPASKPAAE